MSETQQQYSLVTVTMKIEEVGKEPITVEALADLGMIDTFGVKLILLPQVLVMWEQGQEARGK